MKIQMFFVCILSIFCTVKAKAFQPPDATYKGDYGYDHMYNSGYWSRSGGIKYPTSSYSKVKEDLEMKYVPHVNGQPIFIPPKSSYPYEAAFQTPFNGKTQPEHFQSKYESLRGLYAKSSEEALELDHNLSEKVYPSIKVENSPGNSADYPGEIYSSDSFINKPITQNYDHGKVIKEASESESAHDVDTYDVPVVIKSAIKGKPMTGEKYYTGPSVTKTYLPHGYESSAKAMEKKPDFHKVDYNFENTNKFPKYLSDDISYPKSHSTLKNPSDYYDKTDFKDQSDYDNPVVIHALSKEKQDMKDYESPLKPVSNYYDTPMIIKASDKKSLGENLDELPDAVEFTKKQIVHINKNVTTQSHSKKPNPTAKPITSTDYYNKPVLMKETDGKKTQEGEFNNPIVVEFTKKKPIDDSKYPVKKNQNYDMDDYDSPVVVEALIKKTSEDDDEVEDSEFDVPLVVEALTKKDHAKHTKNPTKKVHVKHTKKPVQKESIKSSDKKSEADKHTYYSPKSVDFLIKRDETKDVLHYNKPNLFDTYGGEYLDNSSSIIELKHQNSANINEEYLQQSQVGNLPKSALSETDTTSDEDEDENEAEMGPFDFGSGLINERSKGIEDESRSFFTKSNVWSLMSNFHAQERNKFKKCKTPNNEPGNCMPIQLCPNPSLDLTLDDLLKRVCTLNEVFVGICCPEFPVETLKVKWDNFTESSSDVEELSSEKAKECGKVPESRKDFQFWPWMAPLISASTRRIFCGGVLIKEQYVLTAAHCTRKIPHNQILVVLGPMNKKQDLSNKEFAVIEIKRHAQYNSRTMQNDIALLKLSKPVSLGEFRRFICLPSEGDTYVGKKSVMLGWQGSFAASKNQESLLVISPEECRRGVKIVVGDNIICTESRTEDTMCNLDSGAPLIIEQNGKFEVIGVLTWNRNDCDSSFPAIFTRVSHFRRWIENHSS